jgi:hypothetical protein
MQLMEDYVMKNSTLLFSHLEENNRLALFNNKGFSLSSVTQTIYNKIKNQPHLYVAWSRNENGYYYVGKSFQNGGRWKRQHAYHLGSLAYHLLKTTRYDDQNHAHWIQNWMHDDKIFRVTESQFSIELKDEVLISFIPFSIYSLNDYINLEKAEIRQINTLFERRLINSYKDENKTLLNVQ